MKRQILYLMVILLIFSIGITELYAAPDMFTSVQTNVSRNWRLLEQLTKIDSSGTWADNQLSHNFYNPMNQTVVDSTAISFYEYSQGWFQGWSDCFGYNISQEYITEIKSHMVVFSEYIPLFRSIYTYDDDNRLVMGKLQITGLDERTWFDIKRVDINYDNGALSTILITDISDPENPPTWFKWEFMNDMYGRISVLTEYMSADSLNWQNSSRTSFLYHPADNTNGTSLVDKISKNFPFFLHFEKPVEVGMLTEKVREIWMYMYWRNDIRDTYSYDWLNRMTFHQYQENTLPGEWIDTQLLTYSYDTDGNCESVLQQWWSEDSSLWMNDKIILNTWENTTSADDQTIPQAGILQLSASPNPFGNSLSISVCSSKATPVNLEIFNCKGQKLTSMNVFPNQKLNLAESELQNKFSASGIYFLKAEQDGHSVTTKALKIK